MITKGVLVVVHHEDGRCFIPTDIRSKIYELIKQFPEKSVYFTPPDQHEPPLNNSGRGIDYHITGNFYFVGCYTKPDACVASQIRLMHRDYNNRMILVEDALFEKDDIPYLINELGAEGIEVSTINSSELMHPSFFLAAEMQASFFEKQKALWELLR